MPDLKPSQPFSGVFKAIQPLFRKRASQLDASGAIKAEVRRLLTLDDDIVVMVNEVTCCASDCPDVETIIVVLRPGGGSAPMRIPKAIGAVTMEDVRNAVTGEASRLPL